ncbi:hypothetical protein GCM10025865_15630 [Paraoerskovia sediminicola]|uniref:Uncharacterized protein n=1 Tax=Paraoerskovia sediminicola TaxID=1138587 RepID=A0ABN6XBU7_9CELL|nr:hypothetical protein [Paraoerskovia sediminicola]BDZ42264.1 hypothetical protein GCM10025865_15630 [Paraoerskovia sediminicola]
MSAATALTSEVTRITTPAQATALAHRILLPDRRERPTVVVTTPSGHDEPFIDATGLARELGDLAEVVVVPSSEASWAFSAAMPDATQVYGGAARVYPLDHAWLHDLDRCRVRLAYRPDTDGKVAALVVQDALAAAVDAGLIGSGPAVESLRTSGTVRGVVASRAIVRLDDGGVASISPSSRSRASPSTASSARGSG